MLESGETMNYNNMNILVLGKSGVGKSALINYIFNQRIVESGSGKPVTGKTFKRVPMKLGEMPITLIDTWGLEISKDMEWETLITEFLNVEAKQDHLQQFVHLILYCIDVTGRIEKVDIDTIKKLQQLHLKVIVVLTKGSRASEEDVEFMKNELKKELPNTAIHIVNSVEEAIMEGKIILPQFGKEELSEAIRNSYLDTLRNLLPIQIQNLLLKKVESYKKLIAEPFRSKEAAKRSNKYVQKLFSEDLSTIINKCSEESLQYVSQSLYEFDTEKQYESSNYRWLQNASKITGLGVGGLILRINPVVGLAVIAGGQFISWLTSKSPETIAEEFEKDMKLEIQNKHEEIQNIINELLDSVQNQLAMKA